MDRRDTLAAAFRHSHFDPHDSRGLRSRQCNMVSPGENPSRQSLFNDRPRVLPQLVVYGNPVRGCGDERPEAPFVCKFWRLGAVLA
jgi:hypothetical protein